MKFLKVSTYYSEFIRHAESLSPGLHQLPYEAQLKYFFSFDFGWADYWKRHIESSTPIRVIELVTNLKGTQRKWASENGLHFAEDNWEVEILEAQIEYHKPEIIFFEDYIRPPVYYKTKFPFVKYIISWDGLAYKDATRFEGTDMIATCHEGTVDYYRSLQIPTYHFIFGFETSILSKLEKRAPIYDISFVGSVNVYKNGHRKRLQLLYELQKQLDVNCWISGSKATPLLSIPMMKHLVRGLLPDALKLNELLKHNRGQAFGLGMYQILADSKITVNNHIDAAGAYAANIRLFESTGVGVCLLTDWKQNLHELFEIDKEVVAYRSQGECLEKAKWLLENPEKRKEIASAGQKRVLEHYSLKKRILDFIDHLSLGSFQK